MIIISDFSKTFTTADMPTTWSVFAKSGILGDAYIHDRNALFDVYYPREQSGDVRATEEWFLRHLELFVKYGLTLDQIDAIVMDDRYFAPRAGVAEFLEEIQARDIPLCIVSSGIVVFIRRWFELRFGYTPDVIIANELVIEDTKVVSVIPESIICPLDKSIKKPLPFIDTDIMIIWDNRDDLSIWHQPKKTLGFTDDDRWFGVKLGRDGKMSDIFHHLDSDSLQQWWEEVHKNTSYPTHSQLSVVLHEFFRNEFLIVEVA